MFRNRWIGELGGQIRDPQSVNLPLHILNGITFSSWERIISLEHERLFRSMYDTPLYTDFWAVVRVRQDVYPDYSPFWDINREYAEWHIVSRENAACVYEFARVVCATNAYFEHL